MNSKKIILASASPRRAEILKMAKVKFEVQVSNVEEIVKSGLTPIEVVQDLALQKAQAVHARSTGGIVIGADTIVVLENRILGKPTDLNEARESLRDLSGKRHEVITACAILEGDNQEVFAETTAVYFNQLSEDQIDFYVQEYQPLDKAGAYAIQEYIGAIGIRRIEGDYYNVVGLPINRVINYLE